MAGRTDVLRRADEALTVELAAGEALLGRTLLRGIGPFRLDGDAWVLAVTDRRVLLLTLGTGRQPAGVVVSAPLGAVRVLDAQLRGTAAALVLRFPEAEIGWFTPMAAWRRETARVVDALGLASDADAIAEVACPAEGYQASPAQGRTGSRVAH